MPFQRVMEWHDSCSIGGSSSIDYILSIYLYTSNLPIKKERFEAATESVVPANTKSSTQWAVWTLSAWMSQRNARVSANDAVPMDFLACHDPEKVSKYVCLFVLEARRTDGQPYPPATIHFLMCGFQCVMQANKVPFNMFDKGDQHFWEFHLTLDTVSSDLQIN